MSPLEPASVSVAIMEGERGEVGGELSGMK